MITTEQKKLVLMEALDLIANDKEKTICGAIRNAAYLHFKKELCVFSIHGLFELWRYSNKPPAHIFFPCDEAGKAKRIEILNSILKKQYTCQGKENTQQ